MSSSRSVRRLGLVLAAAVALTLIAAVAALSSHAAFPGANGKVYFDADKDVWSTNPDGSGAKRLTSDYGGYDTDPAASADGTKVAWISERAGIHVWIMNADGSGKTQVTNDTNDPYFQDGDTGPAWSPDGNKIAFASDRKPDKRSHILVVNLLTKTVASLTTPVGGDGYDDEPAWSPNGQLIAFHRVTAGGEQVMTISPSGSGLKAVASGDEPNWAPDGSKIVYHDPTTGGGGQLFTVSPGGGSPTAVPTSTPGGAVDPAFSPDGQQIVYSANKGFLPSSANPITVYRVPASGGASTKVVNPSQATGGEQPRPDWAKLVQAHKRTITLTIKHGVASGKVTVPDGFTACATKVPVLIQKAGKTVKTLHTAANGSYKAVLRGKGSYGAVAPQVSAGGQLCLTATSKGPRV